MTKTKWCAGALLALSWCMSDARADCYDDAGMFHSVNPWVLRAIVYKESGFNPSVVHPRNRNNSEDIGVAGINSIHLPELASYGVSREDLRDPCKSTYIAGWHLRKQIRRYGNTWAAVGAYHSATPFRRDQYAAQIRQIIEQWALQGYLRHAEIR